MPIGSRLALVLVMTALGCAEVRAGQSAGSWTDPPARTPSERPDTASPSPAKAAPPPAQAVAPAVQTARPTAQVEAPRRRERAARREARRTVTPRPRIVARAVPRLQRVARVERMVERVVERRPPPRRLLRYPAEPMPVAVALPPRAEMADPRLERLRSAEAAGYLVVRRRTVVYPDGRAIRIYRPLEEDAFD